MKTKYNFGFDLKIITSVALVVFCGQNLLFAQVQNNGTMYIHDSGQMHIGLSNYSFGVVPASTKTSRTANHGVLSFASGTAASGASDSHYVDGYVRTYGTQLFLAPTGENGIYAPAAVQPTGTTGVDVAYNSASPTTLGSGISSAVTAMSSSEYWNIKGSTTTLITLTWRSSSNLSLLASSLSDLMILGYNGTQWEIIPSTYDATSILGGASTIVSGSISSTSAVDLSTYTAFTLGAKSCFPTVVSSNTVKTWNGSSWSPSAPGIEDPVVINGAFTGSFSAYSVELNADIALGNSNYLEVVDAFTGTGKVIMSSEASLVQRNAGAAAPSIEMTKITNPMRRYDYVFLSSPINNTTTYFSQLANKNNVAVNGQFGVRQFTAFQFYRTYNDAGTVAIDANPANTPVGRGFSASVLNQAPFASSTTVGAWYTEKYPIHIKTTGTTNNGNFPITVPVNGWARIGNPYPSAIDGEELLNAVGNNVRKTIYFWTFNTPRQTLQGLSTDYTNADFAYWNYSGGTAVCVDCQVPSGIIATMQSVMVKSLNASVTPTTFNLTNCMRVTSGNTHFFKTADIKNRYWLNLTGSSNSFSQILIAYNEQATYDYDNGYDSPRITSTTSSSLSSLIGTSKCAIQTRPEFTDVDAVPLNVDKNLEETFSISLADKEGIFNTTGVNIYLHDKDLEVYHDLRTGPYNFVQSQTSDNTRFEVVYRSQALGNPEHNTVKTIAMLNDHIMNIQSSQNMGKIEIYDMTGRLVESYNANNSTVFTQPFYHAQAVYIAKIQLDNGMVVSAKLINQ